MAPALHTERAPILYIGREAWDKIMGYTSACPVEVSGWGYLKVIGPDALLLHTADDVFITPQVVSTISADVHETTLAMAYDFAVTAGRDQELRLQWHSHVCGDAYHSDTDMAAIDNYGPAGFEWVVSVVVNKYGHRVARLDIYRPFRVSVVLEIRDYGSFDEALYDACRAELQEHVQKIVPVGKPDRRGQQPTRVIGVFDIENV